MKQGELINMGYAVYWANGRWQGYGVPAYCDYPGCKEEIIRGIGHSIDYVEIGSGMGYAHDEEENYPNVFCCSEHQDQELNSFMPEKKEHPKWLNHILTDDSWKQWREKEPEMVLKYKKMLKESIK